MTAKAIIAARLPVRRGLGEEEAAVYLSMARRLAEHDATTKQIAAVTGHLSLSEIEKYTRKAAQGRLAAQGMNKIGKSPETSLPISPNDE